MSFRPVAAAFLLISAVAAQAQGPRQRLERGPRRRSSPAASAHSTARSQSHAIAVVDAGGHLVAALRMDGNGYGIMDFALAKARGRRGLGLCDRADGRRARARRRASPTRPMS